MCERREFLKCLAGSGLCGASIGMFAPPPAFGVQRAGEHRTASMPGYDLSLAVATRLFDGQRCWCHARAGIVPGAGSAGLPRVVMTMNTLQLSGSDVFKGMFDMQTGDLGSTWTAPREVRALAPRFESIAGQRRPVAVSDFWPRWHAASRTLLGTGHTVVYTPNWKVTSPRPRQTAYATYDPATGTWRAWRKLDMPEGPTFDNAGAGCTQRFDLADGTILLPISFVPPGKNSRVTVVRCAFDGRALGYLDHGDVVHVDDTTRGIGEPSLTRFDGRFYITIRHDRRGYVTRGDDGLHFESPRPWKFDDGSDLGSYNTQQHWVTHNRGLFLVYTRRGANNDHVFRHRAPLFMAQVDPEHLRVIRRTERILVPERGARLGNFGVTDVSRHETWVTVAEWMQPKGVEKHGSDGSVFVARIKWREPNQLFH